MTGLATVFVFVLFGNFAQTTTTQPPIKIINVDWKFNHILVLPVGCQWASNVIWRVHMRCPIGHFYVPTRLQASTNISRYCSKNQQSTTLFSNADYAHQRSNPYTYLKQIRQLSAAEYGDGILNRYDFPYFPIYSHGNSYWSCIGTNAGTEPNDDRVLKSCSFLVRANDYLDLPASHLAASLPGDKPIATLVLPGPYCSTIDSYEHFDRSGGTVFKTKFVRADNQTDRWESKIDRFDYVNQSKGRNSNTQLLSEDSKIDGESTQVYYNDDAVISADEIGDTVPEWAEPPSVYNYVQVDDPDFNIHQSENVYFALRGESKTTRLRLARCQLRIEPRDPSFAVSLWQDIPKAFERSLLANIHVNFIQIIPVANRWRNYSTFYDDMTALQHERLIENLFRVEDVSPDTGEILMLINFNVKRLDSGTPEDVRVGAAMFEFLVVGDENAGLLQSMWPYRYASPYSRQSLMLLRNVTINDCGMQPGNDFGADDQETSAEVIVQLVALESNESNNSNITKASKQEALPPPPDCWYCDWILWMVIAGLVGGLIIGSIGILHLCTR